MSVERKIGTDGKTSHSKDQTVKAETSTGHDVVAVERLRWSFEDPMHNYLKEEEKKQKLDRVKELQELLDAETSSDSSDDSSGGKRRKKKHSSDKNNRKRHKSDTRDSQNVHSSKSKKLKHKHKHKKWKEKKAHKKSKHKHSH